MNIIFLGAPGAGKGTQAENASVKLSVPTISTGVILREAIAEGTEMGNKAKSYMESGGLVPDDIIINIIKDRLSKPDCSNGFILDGFPRTVPQAEYLEKSGIKIDLVIDIFVPDATIAERMSGRRVCKDCGASYHIVYKPSENGDYCDKCDSDKSLIVRDDDRPEVVLSRLETYHKQTKPLEDYYEKKGLLKTVVGQIEVADTTRLTFDIIRQYLDSTK
jgi:adenylate kinase